MSTGKKKTTTNNISNNDPWSGAVQGSHQLINRAMNLSDRPYIGYGGPTVAGFSQDQEDSFQMARAQAAQNAQWQANAGKYVNDTINGVNKNPYSGENPYLGNMIDAANRDITKNYTDSTLPTQLAQFNSGGAFGGSAHLQAMSTGQQSLAQQLSDTNYQYRNADYDRQANLYNQDQQLRQGALSFLPQLQQMGYNDANQIGRQGALQQALQQQAINDDRDQFNEWRDWAPNQLGILSNALGAVRGGTTSNTATGDNPNYKSAGENAAGYAAILASLWGNS